MPRAIELIEFHASSEGGITSRVDHRCQMFRLKINNFRSEASSAEYEDLKMITNVPLIEMLSQRAVSLKP